MNTTERERLVDAYFDALDEPDYAAFGEIFAPDCVYRYPAVGPIAGVDDVIRFCTDEKPTSNTDHTVERYLHTPAATVVEGTSTGVVDGDPVESHFCDVVEFTADDRIATLAVYARAEDGADQ